MRRLVGLLLLIVIVVFHIVAFGPIAFSSSPSLLSKPSGYTSSPSVSMASPYRDNYTTSSNWVRPADGSLTDGFGSRLSSGVESTDHKGVDISQLPGTPVFAVYRGVVTSAGPSGGCYGNWVVIQHPTGEETIYGHLASVYAEVGQALEKGQELGYEGNTGCSTGVHLHFEIRIDGLPINPGPYLYAKGVDITDQGVDPSCSCLTNGIPMY